jgi:hypothetical protein
MCSVSRFQILAGMCFAVAVMLGATKAPQDAPASAPHPSVHEIPVPDFWGQAAIWGASGNDSHGRIWLGVTSNDYASASAHLFRYDPEANVVTDAGNVIEELTRLGLRRPGERQMKIHSRIVEMPDGFLYFASMDESGEADDGSRMPTWGGHLWRIGPSGRWEHLASAPEALIAVAAGGRYVYALGYFGNVLYQYDTGTATVAKKAIGTLGGHVTRNFFADDRGHAYVPRARQPDGPQPVKPEVELIELDVKLQEVATHPLTDYFEASPDNSHGIVATHPDGTGGWYFATGKGRLYHVTHGADGPSDVVDLGWYHPAGRHYVATMFLDPATGTLYGAAASGRGSNGNFDWVVRAADGRTTTVPLPCGDKPSPRGCTPYGSMTRDARGRFYVVANVWYKPLLFQITP